MKVSQNGLNSLLVTWTQSEGPHITSYTIFNQEIGGELTNASLEANETDTNVTVNDLKTGSNYEIKIVANSLTLPSVTITAPLTTIGWVAI